MGKFRSQIRRCSLHVFARSFIRHLNQCPRLTGIRWHRKQSHTLSSTSAICIWSKATGSWRTALGMSDPRRWNCQCASSSTMGSLSVYSPRSLRMSVRCLRHVSAKAVACIIISVWAVFRKKNRSGASRRIRQWGSTLTCAFSMPQSTRLTARTLVDAQENAALRRRKREASVVVRKSWVGIFRRFARACSSSGENAASSSYWMPSKKKKKW